MQQIEPKMRIVAGMIGVAGLCALATQLVISMGLLNRGPLATLWALAAAFTILTNSLMAGTFLKIAVTGKRLSFDWMSMLTLSMVMVGLVYHALLAGLRVFTGVEWWVDQAFHTFLPVATLWFWLTEVSRRDPRGGRPLLWLIWPFAFVAYALARGKLTGQYVYPFLNLDMLGWSGVGVYLAGMGAAFALLAFGLNALGTRMPLRDHNSAR